MTTKEIEQRVYLATAKHLLQQNHQARNSQGGGCVFKDEFGRRCSYGCWIPENFYRPVFEALHPTDLTESVEAGRLADNVAAIMADAMGCTVEEIPWTVMRFLQRVHDEYPPASWASRLVFGVELLRLGPDVEVAIKEVIQSQEAR